MIELSCVVELLLDMKILYGRQYSEQWGGIDDEALAIRLHRLLWDIEIEQFDYALKKMETQGRIPTLPKFKEWCLEHKSMGQNWFSTNEAWALCLDYDSEKDKTGKTITKQAMSAFSKVKHVMNVEGQKAAFYAFKGLYERITEQDKNLGKPQIKYEAPERLRIPRDTRATDPWTDDMKHQAKLNLKLIYTKLDKGKKK